MVILSDSKMKSEISISKYKQISEDDKLKVQNLVKKVFDNNTLPKIDMHYVVKYNNQLIGYSAISRRTIVINDRQIKSNLLGLVCIENDFRKKGLGSKLLQYIIKTIYEENDYGIVLNCGKSLEKFYLRNGFKRISNRAEYCRNFQKVYDDDPVLYFGSKICNDEYNSVFLGEDF